jgi:hypothetical protein
LRPGKCASVLLLACAVLLVIAASRSFEYDESYSVFVTSPSPRPPWPSGIFQAREARHFFDTHATPLAVATTLRETDVHPPLYFWALSLWREVTGNSLFALRLPSVLCALVSLALIGAIARDTGIPPHSAMLLALLSYGFAYTGAIARGFSLALMLALAGMRATLRAEEARTTLPALLAGLLFGAATLTNYLASFLGLAALGWMTLACWRQPRLWLAGVAGYAAALPAVLWFFLAQENSRTGQFPPFQLGEAVIRLARYWVANLLGGLPLYVEAPVRPVLELALLVLMTVLVGTVARRWHCLFLPKFRWLFLLTALAPALGLIGLGVVFNTTPIELRYLSFSIPSMALLLAAALDGRRGSLALKTVLIGAQSLALAGLAFHPATMQPFRAVARQAVALGGVDSILLAPRGNDGVGAIAPLLAELPDRARVMVLAAGEESAVLGALPSGAKIVQLRLGPDAASRETLARLDRELAGKEWRRLTASPLAAAYERR